MPHDPETFENLYPFPDKTNIREQIKLMVELGQISIPKENLSDTKSWIEERVSEHYKKERNLYNESEEQAKKAWQKHQETEHGFSHLPEELKRKIHGQIWEDGHSGGYGDMENMYYDWTPIILEAYSSGFNDAPTK